MVNVSDVYAALCTYESAVGYTSDVLLPCCRQALDWVKENLRSSADEDSPLIVSTAAAVANFYFFLKKQSETDSFENYKVGDMTISRNPEKEFKIAERKLNLAIAQAHSILKDGGFYCIGK